jgi:type II secretion system protein N
VKKAAAVVIAVLFLVACLWFIAIPESLIADLIENALSREYLYLKAEGVKKGLFYTFDAERILLKNKAGSEDSPDTVLVFNDVQGRLSFLSLLMLHPELDFHGSVSEGKVSGVVRLTGKDSVKINGSDIRINGIPLLKPLGIHGDGVLSGSFLVRNNSGELKFAVKDLDLSSGTIGGVFLPMDLFHDMRGAVNMKSDTLTEVQSVAMSGTGIYARVKGAIQGNDMNMSLELMTDSSFTPGPLFQMMLEKYMISPGYYLIPLKGGIPKAEGG